MRAEPIGIYVHIPFCLKKCNYCDFCSFANLSSDVRARYVSALVKEIKAFKSEEHLAVDSIFFGGGTPSLLSPNEFKLIYAALSDTFNIMPSYEFTVEVNPKTVDKEKLEAFKACGVNRISIGMQSVNENELKKLGRVHNYSDFVDAFHLVRSVGFDNVNVDLMYGIPDQTKNTLTKTLSSLVKLSPEHISAYGLIIEEGTPFFEMKNVLSLPSEDEECDMYDLVCSYLSDNGYRHYEISNYAKIGKESVHNLKYWRCGEYIGFGVSAYSYFRGMRFGNTDSLDEYLSENAKDYVSGEKADAAYEYVMLGLRLAEGISLSEYKKRFGVDFLVGRDDKIREYTKRGYMTEQDGRLSLTEKGFYVSNTILTDLL